MHLVDTASERVCVSLPHPTVRLHLVVEMRIQHLPFGRAAGVYDRVCVCVCVWCEETKVKCVLTCYKPCCAYENNVGSQVCPGWWSLAVWWSINDSTHTHTHSVFPDDWSSSQTVTKPS